MLFQLNRIQKMESKYLPDVLAQGSEIIALVLKSEKGVGLIQRGYKTIYKTLVV